MVKKIKRRAFKKRAQRSLGKACRGKESSFSSFSSFSSEDTYEPGDFGIPCARVSPLLTLKMALSVLTSSMGDFIMKLGAHERLDEELSAGDLYIVPKPEGSPNSFPRQYLNVSALYSAHGEAGPSPIHYKFYWAWAALDLKVSARDEADARNGSVAQLMIDEVWGSTPSLMSCMRAVRDSELGVYVCEGRALFDEHDRETLGVKRGAVALMLRELVTGRLVRAYLPEAERCEPGELLLSRLIRLAFEEADTESGADTEHGEDSEISEGSEGSEITPIYTSLGGDYILSSTEEEWSAYFDRVSSQEDSPREEPERSASYRALMRSEQSPLLWLEYIRCAYTGSPKLNSKRGRALRLAGVPDQVLSMPRGARARGSLLRSA